MMACTTFREATTIGLVPHLGWCFKWLSTPSSPRVTGVCSSLLCRGDYDDIVGCVFVSFDCSHALFNTDCIIPSLPKTSIPSNPDGNTGLTLTQATGVWNIAIPHLSICSTADIVLTSSTPSNVRSDVDPDTIDVQVYVHLWTRADGSGVGCGSDATQANCKRLKRRLPLRWDGVRGGYVAKLVPDTASQHYMFEVQGLDGTCAVSRVIQPAAFVSAVGACAPAYANHDTPLLHTEAVSSVCLPLLHLYVHVPAGALMLLLSLKCACDCVAVVSLPLTIST